MDFNSLAWEYVELLKFNKLMETIQSQNLEQEFYIWINDQNTELGWILQGKFFSPNPDVSKWCYRQALSLNEDSIVANYLLGKSYMDEENWNAALDCFYNCGENETVYSKIARCHKRRGDWYSAAYFSLLVGFNGKKIFQEAINHMNNQDKVKLYNESKSVYKDDMFTGIKIKIPVAKLAKILAIKQELLEENEHLRYRPPELGGPEYEGAKNSFNSIADKID